MQSETSNFPIDTPKQKENVFLGKKEINFKWGHDKFERIIRTPSPTDVF